MIMSGSSRWSSKDNWRLIADGQVLIMPANWTFTGHRVWRM